MIPTWLLWTWTLFGLLVASFLAFRDRCRDVDRLAAENALLLQNPSSESLHLKSQRESKRVRDELSALWVTGLNGAKTFCGPIERATLPENFSFDSHAWVRQVATFLEKNVSAADRDYFLHFSPPSSVPSILNSPRLKGSFFQFKEIEEYARKIQVILEKLPKD